MQSACAVDAWGVNMEASPNICRVSCKLESQESQWLISSVCLKV